MMFVTNESFLATPFISTSSCFALSEHHDPSTINGYARNQGKWARFNISIQSRRKSFTGGARG